MDVAHGDNVAAVPVHAGMQPADRSFASASEDNARFDAWLRTQGSHQGIRDFEAVDALARQIGLDLLEDRAMPADNRCLVWGRCP